jgi:hypothetical protein
MTPPKDQSNQPPEWVHEVLEPDQLSASQAKYPLKKLTTGTLIILWAMRVYVVLMLLLIAYEVWHVMQPVVK